jgi:hypothetical protein
MRANVPLIDIHIICVINIFFFATWTSSGLESDWVTFSPEAELIIIALLFFLAESLLAFF